jgi:hypothetical protein
MNKRMILIALIIVFYSSLSFSITKRTLHNRWDELLTKYVSAGKVDYQAMQNDISQLEQYQNMLKLIKLDDFSQNELKALWINVYNAFTVKYILENYPTRSIIKLKSPFNKKRWSIAAAIYSLNDVLEIKLKEFKDPRIHFAIVQGCIGSPDLKSGIYKDSIIDQQLEEAAQLFFSQKKHYYMQTEKNRVTLFLNKLFKDHKKDFGDTEEEMLKFISRYIPESDAELIKNTAKLKITYLDFDWNLNDSTLPES